MIKKMIKTFERYKPYCMDIIRIYLGFGLFLKGCVFIMHGELLDNYIVILGPYLDILHIKFLVFFLAHYIVFGHLAGGLLLLFGLLTRIAAFVQIPILAGAVFLSTLTDGIFSETQSLEFTILVLFLLIVLFIYGAGPLSADKRLEKLK